MHVHIYKPIRETVLCLLIWIWMMNSHTWAQYNTFSPFSRYGIGDIQDNTLSYQKGMGCIGIALPTDTTAPMFINPLNPASLSNLKLSIIEGGGYYMNTKIVNTHKYQAHHKSANFNALIIGFPIKKHSGFAFGLLPYSFVGYDINQNVLVNNIGNVNYVYTGSGGLNKVFAAYGWSLSKYFKKQDTTFRLIKTLLKNLSIGVNVHYLFGELSQTAIVNYPNNSAYYNFINDRRLRMSGVSFETGIQTHVSLNNTQTKHLYMGVIFSNPSLINVINDYMAYNFTYTYYGEKYIVDTILYGENEAGKMKLPFAVGLGASYIVSNQWGISADVKYTNWKTFQLLQTNTNVNNNIELNIGGYYQPDRFAVGKINYWNKIIYRLGATYNSGYQEYQGKNIPMYGITAGVSLPVGLYRAFSSLHFSAQYFIKGQSNFILREYLFKLNIGVTLNDRWFIKYKYD